MGLWSWFAGPKVTSKDRAILDLKIQRDKIKQYQKRIGGVLAREHALAKECLAKGDRQRALLFLRREKFQSQLLSRTDQQLASLEELVSSIEFAQVQKDVVFGLEQGAAVLKQINAEMSLEKVERIMDDSAAGIAYQEEVEQLLNEHVTNSDELEVEEELARIEAQIVGKKPLEKERAGSVASELPEAPNKPLSREASHAKASQSEAKHAVNAGENVEAEELEAAEERQAILA